ncbi:biotin-dependent carboxyltransferase family protein [Isosphaeraceae bacterium EP7]
MGLIVLKSGLWTTFQDEGRPGYRDRGVPPAGAFDLGSHRLANALLDNPRGVATLELTLDGGHYQATAAMELAIAGAAMPARIELTGRQPVILRPPCAFLLRGGERLTIGPARTQIRAYLAARGGWRSPVVLGSRSSEVPIKAGIVLEDGWTLDAEMDQLRCNGRRLGCFEPSADEGPYRVMTGPDAVADFENSPLLTGEFRVLPQSNRMGLRLEGPALNVQADPDRLSEPVAVGAVQVAGGQPLILGVACGTMGGYPHLAQVVSADLDRLAQARPGSLIRFGRVEPEEARRLDSAHRLEQSAFLSRVELRVRDHRRLLEAGG